MRIKILQVCPLYYPSIGGIEEHVRNLSERLARDNGVTVATTDPSGKLRPEELINGVKVLRFKSWAPSMAYYFSRDLKEYLKNDSGSFDVIHAHSYHAFPALYAAQANVGEKLVFTSHYNGPGHTMFRRLLHSFYKFKGIKIFQAATKVIVVSNFEKDLIGKRFKVAESKVVLVPNGLDLTEFGCRQRSNLMNKTLLYVGRLEKYKGVQYILQALPLLEKDVNAIVVGKGPYKGHLIKTVEKLGVRSRVTFLQDVERQELLQRYVDASVFITMSRFECYGLTVAESLASGTPCIVANTSALTEWVDNTRCFGINYPVNVSDLAACINEISGRRIVPPNLLDWNDVTMRILDVYKEIAD